MKSLRHLALFLSVFYLVTSAASTCPVSEDPLVGTTSALGPIMPISELYVGCGNPENVEELCGCEALVSGVSKSEADELIKTQSEKAWLDAFQGEIWGLGQSLINFESAQRQVKSTSSKALAPSCTVSTIFEKIASFANSEGCDGAVFNERVKSIFKTDSLSEAQRNIVDQVSSISKNEAPASIKNPENICIPYTTFNYMKKGSALFESKNRQGDLDKAKEEIDKKCEALVSDKIQPFFCSSNLPDVDFDNFKKLIHPSVSDSQGPPKATSIAYQHFCSEEPTTSSEDPIIPSTSNSSSLSQSILDNREVTDFEKFNSGIKTDYESFNENVCSLLPKCTQDETKGECRNVITLRAMLIDNLKKKLPSNGSDDFLKLFSRSPEKTAYDPQKMGSLSIEEFNSSSKLLSYLNQFIINKANKLKNSDGSGFLAKTSVNNKSITKELSKDPLSESAIKAKKEKAAYMENLFSKLEGRGDQSLSFGSKDLDKIENPKLLKSFVGGRIVEDPTFTPNESGSISRISDSSPSTPLANDTSTSAASASANEQAAANESIARRFEKRSPDRKSSDQSSNSPSSYKGSSMIPKSTGSSSSYKTNTIAPVGAKNYENYQASPSSDTASDQIPQKRGYRSSDSSLDRYKQAYSNYSGDNLFPSSNNRSPASSTQEQLGQSGQGQSSDEFQNIETGKKGVASAGSSSGKTTSSAGTEEGSGSNAKQPFVLGKDGKPVKGKLKIPRYVFNKIIPQVVIEKMGLKKVILKYGLVGKRFNVLEIDQDNNFILHTYDFSSGGLAYEEGYDNNQYNIVRIDILDQIEEIQKTDQDAQSTLSMLASRTMKIKSDKIKYEITKEEIISNTIPPHEVEFAIASNN